MSQLQVVEPQLVKLGYQILAVSPDKPSNLLASMDEGNLSYSLLSDSTMAAAKAFGIAFQVQAPTLTKYKGYGIDLTAASGEAHNQLPVPSVFVLGTDLKIQFHYVNPNYRARLDPDVLVAMARAAKPKAE